MDSVVRAFYKDNTMAKGTKVQEDLLSIVSELSQTASLIDPETIDSLLAQIKSANRIFFGGAGRTGLAFKMAAMRFMHLGYTVHVVGETTTPAILEGDLLILGSGSGSTSTLVTAGEKAKKQQAALAVLTADENSRLAELADVTLRIPAAVKTDFGAAISAQYAGSLFEQAALLVMDAVFMTLWQESGLTKEELWPKHANLE